MLIIFAQAQDAVGVQNPIKPVKGAMTRWNGCRMCVARNNTLHDPLETSLRKDAEVTIYAIDDDGVVQDGQNGTNVEVRAVIFCCLGGSERGNLVLYYLESASGFQNPFTKIFLC